MSLSEKTRVPEKFCLGVSFGAVGREFNVSESPTSHIQERRRNFAELCEAAPESAEGPTWCARWSLGKKGTKAKFVDS